MKPKKPYHHGHLEETLLDAAIQVIAEKGAADFTLREVARRAGVSHNAPYRHFADRDELLASVAEQGFRELNQSMLDAGSGCAGPFERLKQAGLAYVEFAQRRPEHFTVMFDAPVRKVNEEAFATLVSLVKASQESGAIPPGEPLQWALLAWSIVHGVAKLATAKRLPFSSRAELLQFTRFVIDNSFPT